MISQSTQILKLLKNQTTHHQKEPHIYKTYIKGLAPLIYEKLL